jgi:hypothetical protein
MEGHMRSKSERQSSQMSTTALVIINAENHRRKRLLSSPVRSFGLLKRGKGSAATAGTVKDQAAQARIGCDHGVAVDFSPSNVIEDLACWHSRGILRGNVAVSVFRKYCNFGTAEKLLPFRRISTWIIDSDDSRHSETYTICTASYRLR